MAHHITSPSNERIKHLVRLRDRKHRDAEGLFVVEGLRLFERAVGSGLSPTEVYTDGTVGFDSAVDPIGVDPDVLDKASYRDRSEGLIAVFEQFKTSLDALRPGRRPLFVACESIEKPGNLGAMMRVADAVGAEALMVVSGDVDPFNPNAIRTSAGTIFSVPLATCSLHDLAAWTSGHAMNLVAGHPAAHTPLWDLDLTQPTCLIVGAEDRGLSAAALEAANAVFSIPMSGAADSLNVASALAVAAFEAVRQRRSV